MTYKLKFAAVIVIAMIVIAYSLIKLNSQGVAEEPKSAPVEFMNSVDNYGNKFTVEYYPEEEFCILSIYMDESKTHMWKWSNYTNEIICNYIHYQDDHYVVSFKPSKDYTETCQATIMLVPIEHDHVNDSKDYNSYMIEVGYPPEGGYGFNVYPATMTETLEVDEHLEDNHEGNNH